MNGAPKRPLDLRRGMTAGLIVLAVLAPAIVARSATPVATAFELLVVGLIAVGSVGAVGLAVNRRRARPPDPHAPAPLHVRRAAIVGLVIGVLADAALSAWNSEPLVAFVAGIGFVLWIALLVAGAILVLERRGQARPDHP